MYKKIKGLSYAKIKAYKDKIKEIDAFCKENEISVSGNYSCYEFELDGQRYVVANDKYYKKPNAIFFYAGKTRIIEIYNDLKNGYKLDKRAFRIS